MSKQKSGVYRTFLHSKDHANNNSYVLAEQAEDFYDWSTHTLTIGDCNRKVCLEFPVTGTQKRISMAKVQKLRAALNKIEEWLEQ